MAKEETIMQITKTSLLTGYIHSMEIDVTEEQLKRWRDGELIQVALAHLDSDEREFIQTGITRDEWRQM